MCEQSFRLTADPQTHSLPRVLCEFWTRDSNVFEASLTFRDFVSQFYWIKKKITNCTGCH